MKQKEVVSLFSRTFMREKTGELDICKLNCGQRTPRSHIILLVQNTFYPPTMVLR